MKLYHDNKLVGNLTRYTYETPWAYALLEPINNSNYTKLAQVSHFLNVVIEEDWGDLTPEEEDQVYQERLVALGLTEADIEQFQASRWEVREAESPNRQGIISLYECGPDGWLRWRW